MNGLDGPHPTPIAVSPAVFVADRAATAMTEPGGARSATLVAMATAATIEHHARARVARGGARCQKHALGRAANGSNARRDHTDVVPQVTLRKRGRAVPARVGVVCFYDPTTGTFLSPDPIDGQPGTPDEANPYDYVDNDPINFVDPLGLCRITDAEFDADGNITGGTYVFEENADICAGAKAAAGSGGGLCGGDAWKGVYFYDWDPFNTINWGADDNGGCTVTQANGENFGVWWEGGSTKSLCAQGAAGVWIVASLELCWSWSDSFFDGEVQATPGLGLGFAFSVGGEGCVSAADDPEQLRGWGVYGTGTVLGFNGEVASTFPTDGVQHQEQLRSCLGYGPGIPIEAHGGGGYTFGYHP